MNVLAIVASPRKKGLVSAMSQRVLDGAADSGRQVELVNLYDYNLVRTHLTQLRTTRRTDKDRFTLLRPGEGVS